MCKSGYEVIKITCDGVDRIGSPLSKDGDALRPQWSPKASRNSSDNRGEKTRPTDERENTLGSSSFGVPCEFPMDFSKRSLECPSVPYEESGGGHVDPTLGNAVLWSSRGSSCDSVWLPSSSGVMCGLATLTWHIQWNSIYPYPYI